MKISSDELSLAVDGVIRGEGNAITTEARSGNAIAWIATSAMTGQRETRQSLRPSHNSRMNAAL